MSLQSQAWLGITGGVLLLSFICGHIYPQAASIHIYILSPAILYSASPLYHLHSFDIAQNNTHKDIERNRSKILKSEPYYN